ncbi:hypothetical protein VE03_03348 [Pseudogymnoascus sp. 23342-1-I1]|nr:hypothetical protein VE03_03348 [Pseudogymnoascus sp. 23342-1-I1]
MRFRNIFSVALAALSVSDLPAAHALTPAQWRSQSIYQVLTDRFARTDGSTTATCNTGDQVYCGGSWTGIVNHLDYIQGMGFTAVWISPVVQQVYGQTSDGSSYHGYWAQDITQLNANFGTAQDLKALSAALHARGMYLMVDIVTNHMAYIGCGTCVDYSTLVPFNSQSYYHPFCLIDYSVLTSIKTCWMGSNTVALPDLRTEDSDVQATFNAWITQLVSDYSIDGLRIDSVQQVNNDFWPSFQAAAGGIHALGEVFNGDPAYVCPYQTSITGLLNFPAYYWITQGFQSTSGSMSNIVNGLNTMKSSCSDTTLLGSFLENHDVVRFASLTSDASLQKNAIAFTMLMDGIPIIYAGQEQAYSGGAVPADREATWLSGYNTGSVLYGFVKQVNQIRNRATAKDSTWVTWGAVATLIDTQTVLLRKGNAGLQTVGVFTNKGASSSAYTLTLSSANTGFTANQAVVEVISCTAYTADSSGNVVIAMSGGLPRVLYPSANLSGSGICSALTGASTTAPVSTTLSTVTNPSTTLKTTTLATTSTAVATACTSIAVTFNELVTTAYGTNIKIVGSIAALGSWNTASGVALSASQYTSSKPLWSATISFASGTYFEYKFIQVSSSGAVTWESGSNRVNTAAGAAGVCTQLVSTSWV